MSTVTQVVALMWNDMEDGKYVRSKDFVMSVRVLRKVLL